MQVTGARDNPRRGCRTSNLSSWPQSRARRRVQATHQRTQTATVTAAHTATQMATQRAAVALNQMETETLTQTPRGAPMLVPCPHPAPALDPVRQAGRPGPAVTWESGTPLPPSIHIVHVGRTRLQCPSLSLSPGAPGPVTADDLLTSCRERRLEQQPLEAVQRLVGEADGGIRSPGLPCWRGWGGGCTV